MGRKLTRSECSWCKWTISSTVVMTVLSFIIGINNAALTILSQQKGKKDVHGLKTYLNAFVVVLGILSILVGIIGYLFSEQILVLLNTPVDMLEEANAYLQINFLGILFLMGYNFIATVLRAMEIVKRRYVLSWWRHF